MTKTSTATGFASLSDKTPIISDQAVGFSQLIAAFEMSACPVLILSLDELEPISINDAATEFFRLAAEEAFRFNDYILERDSASVLQLLEELRSGAKREGVVFVSAGDGIGIQRLNLRRVGNTIVAATLAMKPRVASESLQDLDPLTGLMNRRVLEQRIQRALVREDNQWGLLFIDLNDYKQVNDLHGHIEGDRVLVEFARKLAASVRPGDLVVRFGGDEFVVLVERIPTLIELRLVAERIAAEVSVIVERARHSILVTASIGCAMASKDLPTSTDIIDAADRDMYKMKCKRPKTNSTS